MQDETNFLSKEQYNAFIEAIPKLEMYHTDGIKKPKLDPETLQLLFKVIYEGALRVSEAINLTPEKLIKDKELIVLESTKGNKKRGGLRELASVKSETFKQLHAYSQRLSRGQRLFPLSRQRVYNLSRQIGELAGIELFHENKNTTNMTVHTLRHSRAVHYLGAKQGLNVVQKKLRHSNIATTSRYTQVNIDNVKEVENDI